MGSGSLSTSSTHSLRNRHAASAVVSPDLVSDLTEVDMYIGLGTLLLIVLIVLLVVYVF
jgi:hypothetical protein